MATLKVLRKPGSKIKQPAGNIIITPPIHCVTINETGEPITGVQSINFTVNAPNQESLTINTVDFQIEEVKQIPSFLLDYRRKSALDYVSKLNIHELDKFLQEARLANKTIM
jgi:hypothetical protein